MERGISRVPCSQLVVSGLVELEGGVFEFDEDFTPSLLCSMPLALEWNTSASDWVMRKVEELKECVNIYCGGYEEQFKALLIAIEAGQPSLAKSVVRKERELKKFFCFIKFDVRGGSAFRVKGK